MNAYSIDLLHESALLLAAVCMSLSVYVLARGVGNKLNLAYSVLTGTASVWALSFFISRVLHLRAFETIHLNTTLLLGPVALVFIHVLLRPESWFFRALRWLAYAVLILFFPLVTLGLDRYPSIRDVSYYSPAAILVALLYLFFSETLGGVMPRGSFAGLPSREEVLQALKKRNLWIYLGGVGVTLFCVMDRQEWMGRTIPSLGNFGLAIYFYLLKDVVLQHRLLSHRRTLGRILADFVAAVCIGVLFLLLTSWVQNQPVLLFLNAILAAYVAVVSLGPIRRLALLLFEKFFFKEAKRIQGLVEEANKSITGAFHEKAIAEATDRFLQKTIDAHLQHFYVLDEEARRFRSVSFSQDNSEGQFLPPSFPLVVYWEKAREWRPLILSDLELESERTKFFSRGSQVEHVFEALKSLGATIAIPLLFERKVLGFITIAATEPPELWEESWGVLTLLRPYFEHASEALRELDVYARLRERDRLATLGEMAAGLAHEIRNPLGAIKGAVQVLDPKPGDKDSPFLKIILEEVDRLNHVVTQFLDYARPFRADFRNVELNRVVNEVVERFRRQTGGIPPVIFESDPSITKVLCQPELLGQVLQNLLENARNATLAKRDNIEAPRIQVSLRLAPRDDRDEIHLSVKDQGIGIAPENLDKVFIPFFTLSPKGTGLGLSISQRIAEAHGGRLEIESVPEQGTIVHLRFPWRKE